MPKFPDLACISFTRGLRKFEKKKSAKVVFLSPAS